MNALSGIAYAAVSLPGRSVTVDFDPEEISLETMKQEVNSIGYDLIIDKDTSVEEIQRREFTLLRRKTILSILSVAVKRVYGVASLGGRDISNQVGLLLAAVSLLYCGRAFYVTAVRQLRHFSDRHGQSCGPFHGHRVPLQCVQHLLGRRRMGQPRHRMAYLFRRERDDHHLRSYRPTVGRASQG